MDIKELVTMGVSYLLAAILIPIAMGQIVTTATTGWNSAVVTIFQVLVPVIAVIGISLHFIPKLKE